MRSAAASTSALSSTMPATLPAPTPNAGVPLAYAARTLACEPVATTRSLRRISSSVDRLVTGDGSTCTRSRASSGAMPVLTSCAWTQLDQLRARAPALRRGRDDHRVAALERVDDLVGRRRARVGRRRDGAHHADRPRDLDDALGLVDRDHADRLRALQVAQQAERLAVVLADLVVDVADAGRLDRELGQRAVACRLDDRPAGRRRRPCRPAPASSARRCAARRGRARRAPPRRR